MNAPGKALDGARSQARETDSATAGFEDIFHAHYGRIARVIVRIVGDRARAEDLAVEVFWKFWRSPRAHGEKAGGWLYRTAVRMALDELRREARRLRYERSADPRPSPWNPEEARAASEECERVRLLLAGMKTEQAELLLLRHQGLSYEELASALALNPASVGTLLSRAQQMFRREYVKKYGEHENERR